MRSELLTAGLTVTAALLGFGSSFIDWPFWERYLSRPQSPQDLSVEWYQPQDEIEGDYEPLARDIAAKGSGFDTAQDIAARYASSALLVVIGDTIVLERYWGDTGVATRQLTFSFHKTVSALLMGTAIAEGHVADIEDPVGKYISRWAQDERGRPSLRSAMQMSAGYAQPSRAGGPFSQAARFSYGSDIVEATLAPGLDDGARPVFDYGGRSAQVVGLALQNALPIDYAAYLSQRLWKPIGARDAAVIRAKPSGPVITHCCLMATAEDWARIGMLLRDRGRFLSRRIVPEQWVEAMAEPAPTNPNFGLFLWIGTPFNGERAYTKTSPVRVTSSAPFAVDDVVFLDGAGGQRVYVSRKLDLVVVRVGEYRSDWDDTRLFNAVANAVARNSRSH